MGYKGVYITRTCSPDDRIISLHDRNFVIPAVASRLERKMVNELSLLTTASRPPMTVKSFHEKLVGGGGRSAVTQNREVLCSIPTDSSVLSS